MRIGDKYKHIITGHVISITGHDDLYIDYRKEDKDAIIVDSVKLTEFTKPLAAFEKIYKSLKDG